MELTNDKRCRSLLLWICGAKVIEHVLTIGIVNRHVVIATSTDILNQFKRGLLAEYGGRVKLTRTWTESFMELIGVVKRMGTKATLNCRITSSK